jgi:hypothetical protein
MPEARQHPQVRAPYLVPTRAGRPSGVGPGVGRPSGDCDSGRHRSVQDPMARGDRAHRVARFPGPGRIARHHVPAPHRPAADHLRQRPVWPSACLAQINQDFRSTASGQRRRHLHGNRSSVTRSIRFRTGLRHVDRPRRLRGERNDRQHRAGGARNAHRSPAWARKARTTEMSPSASLGFRPDQPGATRSTWRTRGRTLMVQERAVKAPL